MTPSDFLATSRDLAGQPDRRRPRQTNLRRAVSTTYYALFHCLAACCADTLVGGSGSNRSSAAWRQAYRGLQHTTVRQRCTHNTIRRFPDGIQAFARKFVEMQGVRQQADYDPEGTYYRSRVIRDIEETEAIIGLFEKVAVKDRRAFAIWVLLNVRSS